MTFDQLIDEALSAQFEGWDFSTMDGRYDVAAPPWNYTTRVEDIASRSRTLVDLGTGGGEFLASLAGRAPLLIGTEGWMPNVPVAGARLQPLKIHVVAVEGAPDNAVQRFTDVEGRLPFCDGAFDAVINRHEAFRATEVARIVRPGGTFLTQQVGSRNEIELNEALGGDVAPCLSPTLDEYVAQLERAGLEVIDAQEAFVEKRYRDIGALVYFINAVPWQYEGFDVVTLREPLHAIHEQIQRDGAFVVHMHRFLLEARKPGA